MKTFKANSHVSQREVEMGQVRVRVTSVPPGASSTALCTRMLLNLHFKRE